MQCQNCKIELTAGAKFCPECGSKVTNNCTSCGKQLTGGEKFCSNCGTQTPGVTPSTDYKGGSNIYYSQEPILQTQKDNTFIPRSIEINCGDTLAERYVVKKKIGQGGFGGVYSVHDTLTDKDLAIKVLPFIDKSSIKNILLEFESRDLIKSFEHVIKAYQPQQAQYKGQDLIIYPMELAEKSMREWLEETRDNLEERLEEGLEIFKQACRGVEAIHEAGLIHLDLKPENILLTENKKAKDITEKWQVKISDFGLARGLGNTNLEMLQDGIGTPAYMAPEQIMAARWKDVKEPADIYALGMILYELIDGDLPYSGTPQQIREKKRDTQIPITALQSEREIAKVAMECLERDKTKRIKSVGEILVTIDKKRKEEEENKKRREKAKKLLEEGKRLVEKNKYEEALKLFKEAEQLDNDNVEIKEWKRKTDEEIQKVREEEKKKRKEEEVRKAEQERKRKEIELKKTEEKREREEAEKKKKAEEARKRKEAEENKLKEEEQKQKKRAEEEREREQKLRELKGIRPGMTKEQEVILETIYIAREELKLHGPMDPQKSYVTCGFCHKRCAFNHVIIPPVETTCAYCGTKLSVDYLFSSNVLVSDIIK